MGSIVSFPILCIANAALCRFSMEISSGLTYKVTDKQLRGHVKCPLMINGDDCGLKGRSLEKETAIKPSLFNVWLRVTAFGGLESSVGKTFRSRKFMTINSEKFDYLDSDAYLTEALNNEKLLKECNLDKLFTYRSKPYVNFGLVYGQGKDGIRGKGSNRMGPLHKDLYETCPQKYFAAATELFIEHNKDAINCHKIPKFIPEWLGGLGLIAPKEKKTFKRPGLISRNYVTENELVVATLLRQNISFAEDHFLKPKKIDEPIDWLLHKITKKYLKEWKFLDNHFFRRVGFDHTYRDLSEEYGKLYKSLICFSYLRNSSYLLLTSDKPVSEMSEDEFLQYVQSVEDYRKKKGETAIHQIMSKVETDKRMALQYKHNERAWEFGTRMNQENSACARATMDSARRHKIARGDLLYEQKKGYLSCFDTRI